ncbi:hypothetical protein [Achromobacter sp. NFACC18-2]|uniref:hypothetical protein n=1 Tax=Achromobacter sp. NFACC18-2 TaxID=1564112 RepID=UPI0008C5EDAF|nr:hypothetical protein [Achromobacter sp. NFACC18-2]SEI47997.1 hypothetical protein SAMN03159494_00453 [Achromobacter sp. NFACC18-2]
MEPKNSVGQAPSQDNAVEATSTPDDLPVRPADHKGAHAPVRPSDASDNAQGEEVSDEVSDEDLEPSDATADDPVPGDAKRTS